MKHRHTTVLRAVCASHILTVSLNVGVLSLCCSFRQTILGICNNLITHKHKCAITEGTLCSVNSHILFHQAVLYYCRSYFGPVYSSPVRFVPLEWHKGRKKNKVGTNWICSTLYSLYLLLLCASSFFSFLSNFFAYWL